MKRIKFFLIVFLLCNDAFSQCYDNTQVVYSPVACDNRDWVMYFEDNFEGDSLDASKWIYPYQGVVAGYDFSGWKNWYANTGTNPAKPVSDNVVVENGYLKIIARKENPPITGTVVTSWTPGGAPLTTMTTNYDYSSGWLESKKKFGYGWYEIRCKIPKGRGFWPAFWLYDENSVSKKSEIDIFEFWNESTCLGAFDPNRLSKNPHFNIHSSKINPGFSTCPGALHTCGGPWGVDGTDFSEIFHVFAVEWDYFKIVWYIDGQPVQHRYRFNTLSLQNIDCNSLQEGSPYYLNESWPFTDRMQVKFNMALQSGYTNPLFGGGYNNAPDGNTPFPSAFEIDYFRYYKRNGACQNNITFNGVSLDPEMYNNMSGQNVTVQNQIVYDEVHLDVTGAISITLDPGFEAMNGSDFLAHIDPDYCIVYSARDDNDEIREKISDKYEDYGNTPLGMSVLSELDVLTVYPNPSTDHVMIGLTSSRNGANQVEITDSQGRVLLRDIHDFTNEMKLDVCTFSLGTYFIKVLNKETGKVYLERFTKSK